MKIWPECPQSSTKVSHHLNWENHSNVCSLPQHFHQKVFCAPYVLLMLLPWVWSESSCKCIISLNQLLENWWLHLTCVTVNTYRKAVQSIMPPRLTKMTQKVAILQTFYHEFVLFSVLSPVGEFGNFGYTFVFRHLYCEDGLGYLWRPFSPCLWWSQSGGCPHG